MKKGNLAEPVFLRNLVVFPITGINGMTPETDARKDFNLLAIDEVTRLQHGTFRELETPDVNEIVFDNRGNNPVLMLDGEEITGSMQNRIIASSEIVAAQSSKNLPVICVEEGRWQGLGTFKTGNCSYPTIRTILVKSLHKKIDTQRTIWKEIDRKLTITKTISTTSSLHDIYNNLQDEVARYVEDFRGFNHETIGFIGVASNRILGCDIFTQPKVYQKFERKLIRSYALDAIEYQNQKYTKPDVKVFFIDVLNALEKKMGHRKKEHLEIKGAGCLGQALLDNNHLIHLSAFPV